MEDNVHASSIVSEEQISSKQVCNSPPKEVRSTNEIEPRNVHKAKDLARKIPLSLIGLGNNKSNPSILPLRNNHFCQQ